MNGVSYWNYHVLPCVIVNCFYVLLSFVHSGGYEASVSLLWRYALGSIDLGSVPRVPCSCRGRPTFVTLAVSWGELEPCSI
ncbi:hypothetical protein P154DRAFT_64283 [Amniculicola lignicola CBS 123094]|uniref:Uncharacterized protein n=1 Tax=Amniculicola lignicola CBS 123094 TaxID=1392246 RepID=A0A6A5WQL2_9PLEO|nr:hypothetical protein P154DRAFT_64283 [Amniculicola lignicola CBS 123094]